MDIKKGKHYAYMLRCNDNSIYSGYAVNPYKRVEVHNSGKGAKYTRAKLPVKLVYFEEFDTKVEALKREREFKKYSHIEKEKIIKKQGRIMSIKYKNKIPTPEEFNTLTDAVGWGKRKNSIVKKALENTLYSICVFDNDKLIGYGRIIGDKTIFLYIHDIMVIPEYQGKKIGTEIMNKLLNQIEKYKKINPNIRTYLGASKGKESFYEKFGFISRPNEDLGAGMILYNK